MVGDEAETAVGAEAVVPQASAMSSAPCRRCRFIAVLRRLASVPTLAMGIGKPGHHQQSNAPPFMLVAIRSVICLSTKRLRCSLATHGCR